MDAAEGVLQELLGCSMDTTVPTAAAPWAPEAPGPPAVPSEVAIRQQMLQQEYLRVQGILYQAETMLNQLLAEVVAQSGMT
eukprot:gene6655-6880_t